MHFFTYSQRREIERCLEGTTERSDDNRVRSARIDDTGMMCLEGTTPVAMYKEPVLWRSAFQAHRPHIACPGTSYPVTKKLRFCSAFQALNT